MSFFVISEEPAKVVEEREARISLKKFSFHPRQDIFT